MKNKLLITGSSLIALALFAGCQTAQETASGNSSSSSNTVQASNSQTQQAAASSTSTADSKASGDVTVSVQEAIEAYQTTYPDSDIISLELDTSFGNYFYKIEGVDDTKEYEVRVDAKTKEISKEREETLDREDQNGVKRQEDKLDVTDILGIDEVSEIAEKEAGSGTATDWDLEQEHGVVYWTVKVKDNQKTTQIEINAKTGEVLSTELDD